MIATCRGCGEGDVRVEGDTVSAVLASRYRFAVHLNSHADLARDVFFNRQSKLSCRPVDHNSHRSGTLECVGAIKCFAVYGEIYKIITITHKRGGC